MMSERALIAEESILIAAQNWKEEVFVQKFHDRYDYPIGNEMVRGIAIIG